MSPNVKEPKEGSAESDGQNKQENFESVVLVHDGYDLPYDVLGTPKERHRECGVNTEHVAHDHDYDSHDYDDYEDKDKEEATLRRPPLGRGRAVCESPILRAFRDPHGLDEKPKDQSRTAVERSESLVFSSEMLSHQFCISLVSVLRASCTALLETSFQITSRSSELHQH